MDYSPASTHTRQLGSPCLRRVDLPTGCLTVQVHGSDQPLEALTGFAARNNPKRGFLFVSKVLGKHLPVRPSMMERSQDVLARKIVTHIPQIRSAPALVVGMAETATALGQGVFQALAGRYGVSGVYLATTRYRIAQPCIKFEESHSHAVSQFLHLPVEPKLRVELTRVHTAVLVDDEVSTGNTFLNVIDGLTRHLPSLRTVIIVTLLNWLNRRTQNDIALRMPCPTHFVHSLLGSFSFTPDPDFSFGSAIRSEAVAVDRESLLPLPGGRRGVDASYHFDLTFLTAKPHLPPPDKAGKILVLGTGEFMFEPYCLALSLEKQGYDVFFQATTRSPILVGHDIASVLQFEDNYGEGIDNFLYNCKRETYTRIILCYETPTLPSRHILAQQLNADILHFAAAKEETC